eukprot:TRINITY_DN449_c0_g1_i1.p1 TRINITY_DN449_c0_g1~~TRINITY_DN449_c0_g1_i1.p1  ORF type:complete len:353 (-),score=38.04 TRINITY_DN449_c0_g1_i1:22-1080(-)
MQTSEGFAPRRPPRRPGNSLERISKDSSKDSRGKVEVIGPDVSQRLTAANLATLLQQHSGRKSGTGLPPLKPKRQASTLSPRTNQLSSSARRLTSTSSRSPTPQAPSGTAGKRSSRPVPRRGRSSEPSESMAASPRDIPSQILMLPPAGRPATGGGISAGSRALMARRTFSLPRSNSPAREASERAEAQEPRLAATSQGCMTSSGPSAWRPPRPPGEVSPLSPGGGGRGGPPSASSSEASAMSPQLVAAAPRPESQARGHSRCSDPGPTRSILRTSQSAERSQSQGSKRVTFSGDCKPAPPASLSHLLFASSPKASTPPSLDIAEKDGSAAPFLGRSPRPQLPLSLKSCLAH